MKLKNRPHKERSPEIENEENDRALVLQKYWRAFLGRK